MAPSFPTRVNLAVLAALLALALFTWGIAYVDLGRWNLVLAVLVAVIKMMLIVLFFMHGWFMQRLSMFAFGAGLVWLGILFALTLSDYLSRGVLTYGGVLPLSSP